MKKLKHLKDVPAALKAGYQHYDIRVCPGAEELAPRYIGSKNSRKRRISLDGEALSGDGVETLLHEICHVAWTLGSLSEVVGRDAEEKVVDIMSTHLATMMHDNPDLFKWIIKNVG